MRTTIGPLSLGLLLVLGCSDGNAGGSDGSSGAGSTGDGTTPHTGSDDSSGDSDLGADESGSQKPGEPVEIEGEIPDPPTAACSSRLEPMDPFGKRVTVGDGTPKSCGDAELKAAISTIRGESGGGTVLFDCGNDKHTIVLDGAIVLENDQVLLDGENRVALSGNNTTRVIETSGGDNHLMLQRIEIRDGRTEIYGGGIFSDWRGRITAIDVLFENNHATEMVGEKGGGAVRLEGPNDTIFSGCTFVGNTAINGGAVYSTAGNVEYVGVVFKANQALGVTPDPHTDGLAYGAGGAIRLDAMHGDTPKALRFCGCVFEDNFANGTGAVDAYFEKIHGEFPKTFIESTVFKNNTGPSVGAYIHMNGELHMKNSAFIGSRGESNGAIFLATSEPVTIDNCTFADNRADSWASVRVRDGETTVTNTTFVGNITANYVPVFSEGDSDYVTLSSSVFLDNKNEIDSHPRACRGTLAKDGGNNIQWPATRPNGSDDVPCTESIVFEDPGLGELTMSDAGIPFYPRLAGGKADALKAGATF